METIHDLTFPAHLMKETLMFMKECPGMLGEGPLVYVRETEALAFFSPLTSQYLSSQELHSPKTKDISRFYESPSYFPLRD